jgi:hypothetical protein
MGEARIRKLSGDYPMHRETVEERRARQRKQYRAGNGPRKNTAPSGPLDRRTRTGKVQRFYYYVGSGQIVRIAPKVKNAKRVRRLAERSAVREKAAARERMRLAA